MAVNSRVGLVSSGGEGGAKECQVFCQDPITLDFLPTHPPDPDLKPKLPHFTFHTLQFTWHKFRA